MGLYNRPYWKDDEDGQGRPGGGAGGWSGHFGGMTIGLPKPTRVVKWLLLINFGIFLVQVLFHLAFHAYLAAYLGMTVAGFWQVWRYVTFQFLHDTGSLWHIGLNMLGLYMFGSPLEQRWGGKRFLWFYLTCGVTAGVAYVLIGTLIGPTMLPRHVPLIGASGGIFGILLAAAVLFPQFQVILFIFPVPIRIAAALIFGAMILVVLNAASSSMYIGEFWSDVAHLGGTLMACAWLWGWPLVRRAGGAGQRMRKGAWQRKMDRRIDQQQQIDRILRKIHDEGLGSLSGKEKKVLKDATRKQQDEDRDLYRL